MERVLTWIGVSDAQNQAAVLQGVTNVIGVALTAAITAWIALRTWNENARLERERRADQASGEQKRRDIERQQGETDLRRALRAEIFNVWQAQYLFGSLTKRLAAAKKRFRAARTEGENFTPFVASSIGTILRDSLVMYFAMLEEIEIQSVVGFYRQVRVVESFSADLRTAAYASLEMDRKETMLADLLRMEDRLVLLAEECLNLLETRLAIPIGQNYVTRKSQIDQRADQ